jgi:cysteinyl-tRNA synthetase
LALITEFDTVLGLDLDVQKIKNIESKNEYSEEVKELIEKRNAARASKNWAEADRIRDLLTSMGVKINDSKV